MYDRLFERLGHRYIAAMLLATRLSGSIGGVLVVYYINLTLTLPEPTRSRFITSCAVVVVLAVILSLLMARWETRHLCTVLAQLFAGKTPDHETAVKAGREAVVFPDPSEGVFDVDGDRRHGGCDDALEPRVAADLRVVQLRQVMRVAIADNALANDECIEERLQDGRLDP